MIHSIKTEWTNFMAVIYIFAICNYSIYVNLQKYLKYVA